ncbi:hypothetical protein [Streptomyces sp. TP-A0874]|uniref:hypothetical protein n=1 Tax=Streptomyces sp. TP-A0874 TaxID=549819 RepID=UPI001FCD6EC7|nr:hypothetical protein [Streptomyces sp. TP-A0874]
MRQLASDLGLADNTVVRAYRELESAGLVQGGEPAPGSPPLPPGPMPRTVSPPTRATTRRRPEPRDRQRGGAGGRSARARQPRGPLNAEPGGTLGGLRAPRSRRPAARARGTEPHS